MVQDIIVDKGSSPFEQTQKKDLKMKSWKMGLAAALLMIVTPCVCVSKAFPETAQALYAADEDSLLPQPEKFFYEALDRGMLESPTSNTPDNAVSVLADSSASWEQVNLEGFDPVFYWRGANNYGVFDDSFAVYNGLLYAGTDNPNYGPEIWAYNGDGSTTWTKVSDQPSGYSFLYGGEATQFLFVFQNYLYAGTVYGAAAPLKANGQLWRTQYPEDGSSWEKVFDYNDWLVKPSGGDTGDLISIIVFNNYLYMGASAVRSGSRHAEIFRSLDGGTWTKVLDENSPNGFNDADAIYAYPFKIFNFELYVGVVNKNDGVEIWKTSNGIDWAQVNVDGMTGDVYQTDRDWIRQFIVYNDYLYAMIRNNYGSWWLEVWRSHSGTDWTQVGGNGLGAPANNKDGRGVELYNGCLYVGTGGYFSGTARVYRTCDGSNFTDTTNTQLGDANNHGVMALRSYDGYLYAGTYRYISGGIGGTEVWRYRENVSDTDGDGIDDTIDNCPNKPNGPNFGTCSSTSDKSGMNCTSDADCANGCSSNGLCIKDQRDTDNDGVGDVCDNCPQKPNGPLLGTCMPGSDKAGSACHSDADCVNGCSSNGKCSLNQEDTNGDGVGDVCPSS
jgi:hypothetical protein